MWACIKDFHRRPLHQRCTTELAFKRYPASTKAHKHRSTWTWLLMPHWCVTTPGWKSDTATNSSFQWIGSILLPLSLPLEVKWHFHLKIASWPFVNELNYTGKRWLILSEHNSFHGVDLLAYSLSVARIQPVCPLKWFHTGWMWVGEWSLNKWMYVFMGSKGHSKQTVFSETYQSCVRCPS